MRTQSPERKTNLESNPKSSLKSNLSNLLNYSNLKLTATAIFASCCRCRRRPSSASTLKPNATAIVTVVLLFLALACTALVHYGSKTRAFRFLHANYSDQPIDAEAPRDSGPQIRGYRVLVDGKPVGTVLEKSDVYNMLETCKRLTANYYGFSPDQLQTPSIITVQEIAMAGAEPLSGFEDLMKLFESQLSWFVDAFMINVNDEDVVAVKTRSEAENILSDIRSAYLNTGMDPDSTQIVNVSIKERIGVEQKLVPANTVRTYPQARQILMRGTDKIITHTVQRGQSLWAIARAHNVSVEDIKKANPDLKSDNLAIGQEVNVSIASPYVTVQSVEMVTSQEKIPYETKIVLDENLWPWQEKLVEKGSAGLKKVTFQVKRQNGVIVEKNLKKVDIIKEPIAQVVLRGSKLVPPKGTGKLAWPVQGTISSYYGWRWNRFHHGVDIAAPAGTRVYCADDGVVVFSGWKGTYGQVVMVDHGQGKLVSVYAHLQSRNVKAGQDAKKGENLGTVGSTGRATGAHLHFEIRVNGSSTNPLNHYE